MKKKGISQLRRAFKACVGSRLLVLLTPRASGKRGADKSIADGAAPPPRFKHSIGTMPCWPLVFMHSAHPSSYSANTRMVSPTLIDSSSGRLVMKVHTTAAPKGERFADVGKYTAAFNASVLPPPPPSRNWLEIVAGGTDKPS